MYDRHSYNVQIKQWIGTRDKLGMKELRGVGAMEFTVQEIKYYHFFEGKREWKYVATERGKVLSLPCLQNVQVEIGDKIFIEREGGKGDKFKITSHISSTPQILDLKFNVSVPFDDECISGMKKAIKRARGGTEENIQFFGTLKELQILLDEVIVKEATKLKREDLNFKDRYRHSSYPGKLFKLGAVYSPEYRRARKVDCAIIPADERNMYEEIHCKAEHLTAIKVKTLYAFKDSKSEIHWFSTKPSSQELSRKKLKRCEEADHNIEI